MTRSEFLQSMDEMLELPQGTLTGSEPLDELENWDSVAMMSFIALVNSNNGMTLSPKQIVSCGTVDELLTLAKVV